MDYGFLVGEGVTKAQDTFSSFCFILGNSSILGMEGAKMTFGFPSHNMSWPKLYSFSPNSAFQRAEMSFFKMWWHMTYYVDTSWLTAGLHPNTPLLVECKYREWKMHLRHRPFWHWDWAWPTWHVLRALPGASRWATLLSFISRVIALLFLSAGAEDTGGCFVALMGCENTQHNIQRHWQHKTWWSPGGPGSCGSRPLCSTTRQWHTVDH